MALRVAHCHCSSLIEQLLFFLRWRLASRLVCFRSGAGAWESLARALVFLGRMFQRGGGVQPAARLSFKCSFFLAVATSIPPRMFDVTVGKLPRGASELFLRVPTKIKR